VPVIVSSGGSLPEIAGDAAIVLPPTTWRIPPGDREGASSPELSQKLTEKGFRQAAMYSWKRTAAETLAVYRELKRAREAG
jgi:glycosyltransferase involved in cell wall biosynthesis